MHPDDIPKTAIITPFGLFELLRLPFVLRNAGSTFQRMMDQVLDGLPFIFVYLDDIIVASKSLEQHKKDVWRKFSAASGLLTWSSMERSANFWSRKSSFLAIMSQRRGFSHFRTGGCSARSSQAFYGEAAAGIPWGG